LISSLLDAKADVCQMTQAEDNADVVGAFPFKHWVMLTW
jgi:hypothetical protein